MVIGGSPASTAGGIKTTTFAVLVRGIVMTVKGYSRMEFFNRSVSNSIIFSAMSAILLATATIGVSTILLTITESHSFLDLLFEEISAFATVGLSRGITSELSSWGKSIIIFSMFMGRVGILTFVASFAGRVDTRNYRYPEETVMVS
jgi:Trk-type K+ transport system membrane component